MQNVVQEDLGVFISGTFIHLCDALHLVPHKHLRVSHLCLIHICRIDGAANAERKKTLEFRAHERIVFEPHLETSPDKPATVLLFL